MPTSFSVPFFLSFLEKQLGELSGVCMTGVALSIYSDFVSEHSTWLFPLGGVVVVVVVQNAYVPAF